MIKIQVLKDASEIIPYNNPTIPFYIQKHKLSQYPKMEALCHWHEDIEYVKAVKGHLAYYINGEKIIIQEHDGVLLNSRQMHYGYSDDGTDCTFICTLFKTSLLSVNQEIAAKYIQPVTNHPGFSYSYLHSACPRENEIIRLFDELYEIDQKPSPCHEIDLLSRLFSIWSLWYRLLLPDLADNCPSRDHSLPVLKKMVTFIYENYRSGISLNEIAHAGGVSRSKCCQIFKQHLLKSPVEFLNAYRLEMGMQLLSDTAMNITEIAFSCGFHSSSYFSEIFQQYKGCSPSVYRRQQRNGSCSLTQESI